MPVTPCHSEEPSLLPLRGLCKGREPDSLALMSLIIREKVNSTPKTILSVLGSRLEVHGDF